MYILPYTRGLYMYINKNKSHLKLIREVYFSDDTILHSARRSPKTPEELDEIEAINRDYKIKLNYVLNPSFWPIETYFPDNIKELCTKIEKLKSRGIEVLTCNNTMFLKHPYVRERTKDFVVKNSVNNLIVKLEQVKMLVEHIGLREIFLGRDINRNFDEIKRISKYCKKNNITLNLLINELCNNNCIYKRFCDDMVCQFCNYPELYSELNEYRGLLACNSSLIANFGDKNLLKRNFILPESIPFYMDYIDKFKISGRDKPIELLSKVFDSYLNFTNDIKFCDFHFKIMNRKNIKLSLHTNLNVLSKINFFEKVCNCKNNCADCNYCDSVFRDYFLEPIK